MSESERERERESESERLPDLYTLMAASSNGRWGEEEYSLFQQCQLPEDKHLGSKVMEKITETASWVNDLGKLSTC